MKKKRYYLAHKPYKVLSQFTSEEGNPGLASCFDLPKDVYPIGRLDLDSEGLLLLTNDRSITHRLLHPDQNHTRTYWVEVEGIPSAKTIEMLSGGVTIRINGKKHPTKKAVVQQIHPSLPERVPPVNTKKHPVRSWLALTLTEGKNRQVRRMTASVGHPTLRLIRVAIEDIALGDLKAGEWVQISEKVFKKKLKLEP